MRTLYSHNEDDWLSATEDVFDAVERVLDDMSDKEFSTCTEVQIYQGVAKEYNISDFFSAEQIIENIQEDAWWEGDEAADGYLENLDEVVVEELKQAIVAWADKHNLHPDFYNVVDVKPYTYVLQEGNK